MYGKWFLLAFSVGIVVLLSIALTPFVAVFAVALALLLAVAIVLSRASRRTQQVGSEHEAAEEERRRAGQAARPSASAAPRSGEGT
jgi:uncharacterized protein (DUF58 family)